MPLDVITFFLRPICAHLRRRALPATGPSNRLAQTPRQIELFEFLTSLVFGQLSAKRQTLSSQSQGLAEAVTRQGIDQRYGPAAMMSCLYRVRWQVELIFRQMKSVLRLDETESENPCRVQSEIWARLSCAVLLFLWHAHASAECWARYRCEASFEKIVGMLQHWGHTIARVLLGSPALLLEELRKVWQQILRNGRKGKSRNPGATPGKTYSTSG